MFETSRATEANQSNNKILTASTKKRQEFYEQRSLSDGTIALKDKAVEGRVVRGRKNPYWLDFADRLRRSREGSALSQNALGLLVGIDSSQVHALENGSRPKISTVEKLAAALSVPACYLAFGERGERPFSFRIPRSEQPLPIGAPSAKPGDDLHLGFAARLTQARELRGLSLRELSRRAALSVTAVSNYERSINLPLVDAVEQLAVALSVSPCWLAYGTGDAPGRNPPEAEPTAEA